MEATRAARARSRSRWTRRRFKWRGSGYLDQNAGAEPIEQRVFALDVVTRRDPRRGRQSSTTPFGEENRRWRSHSRSTGMRISSIGPRRRQRAYDARAGGWPERPAPTTGERPPFGPSRIRPSIREALSRMSSLGSESSRCTRVFRSIASQIRSSALCFRFGCQGSRLSGRAFSGTYMGVRQVPPRGWAWMAEWPIAPERRESPLSRRAFCLISHLQPT